MFNIVRKEINWGGKTLEIETGKIARQASGSVVVKMGGTMLLCTAVAAKEAKEGINFLPLTVQYLEKYYAGGRIPGGFFKRENKPTEREVLISRLIDRPIRPLFPKHYTNETQVICTVLSYDPENDPDVLALVGASAALAISDIPFTEPVAAARVGYVNGEFVLNPSKEEMEPSELDLVVAGTKTSVLMVESEAKELSKETMLAAVTFGHEKFQPVIQMIEELAKEAGKEKMVVEYTPNTELEEIVRTHSYDKLVSAYKITNKSERREEVSNTLNELKEALSQKFTEEGALDNNEVVNIFHNLEKEIVRKQILGEGIRIDGRKSDGIRDITCEMDLLPMTHGSALFTRGETQALVVTTLGSTQDQQMTDDLMGNAYDRFMLHYNFPPYSVGEASHLRAPGRREIGHGKLAWRSLNAMMPEKEEFPYTIRIVSEVTESNGSSSMATVCGASLSLMAAGVPIKSGVSGIAMGLIKEGDKYVVLSDIMGDEDYLGDMDFKVAGTSSGITALQMDIKINGISREIMSEALEQAEAGRKHILDKMTEAISASRKELSSNAPRILSMVVEPSKIRDVIGAGGKVIKEICEKSGAKVDISDSGEVQIAGTNLESAQKALEMVSEIVAEPELGKVYEGSVVKITDFGLFVRFLGNTEGLVHISEISAERVNDAREFFSEGDITKVKVIEVERSGRVRLSVKAIAEPPRKEGFVPSKDSSSKSFKSERGEGYEGKRRHDNFRRDSRRDGKRSESRDNGAPEKGRRRARFF